MVEKTADLEKQAPPKDDYIIRDPNVPYGKFRDDKEQKKGHSKELVSVNMNSECYEDIDKIQPTVHRDCDTLLKHFDRHAKERPKGKFLGQRPQTGTDAKNQPLFGEYEWKDFLTIKNISENIAKEVTTQDLAPEVDGEQPGEKRRFIGIWARNRWEWLTTMIVGMRTGAAIVGFYDAMNQQAVNFILEQTQLTTIFVEDQFVKKIIDAKKEGKYVTVKHIVNYDMKKEEADKANQIAMAKEAGLTLQYWKDMEEAGGKDTKTQLSHEAKKDDDYILSYTSGTTGDSKGVKLTHNNILSVVHTTRTRVPVTIESRMISYLPLPHSFEQCMVAVALLSGCQIGYFQGNPLKLTEDCAMLKPTMFPSVPRLYNKIYAKIKGNFDVLTGCKKWLVNKGLAAKTANLHASAATTSGCYDKLVFNKIKAILGGCVEYMVTGSAPIDLEVLAFLKVAFCCPIFEGYGLTETSGASFITLGADPVAGHVGGPLECIKARLRDVPDMNYLSSDKPHPRGEVQMWGASITKGYYKNPEKTAEAFDEDGWFCSGDVGVMYPNGTLRIIDRSKNIFKLSQGEYIAPEKLEQAYSLVPEIAQCLIYGDSLKNNIVAVIVLEEEPCKKWATENKQSDDMGKLCSNEDLKKHILDAIVQIKTKKGFTSLEKPAQLFLSADPFSVENGILTTTFKLKRNEAKKVYQGQIDAMYVQIEKDEAARAAKQ